jgi:hypothetical protein
VDLDLSYVREELEKGRSARGLAKELGVHHSKILRARDRMGSGYRSLSVEPEDEEIPVFFRDYSHLDKLHLYALGDVHKGAKSHAATRWREWLAYLEKTPYASMLGTGDFLNCAIVNSKSDVYDERMTVGQAKRELRTELEPLAHAGRLDGLADGNHEDRITRAVGDSPVEDLCDWFDVPYVAASALFVYTVGNQTYQVFLRHGTGNGQSAVALTKGSNIFPTAEVHVTGHTHRQIVMPDDFFVLEGDRAIRRHRHYVCSGSFLKLEKYAAQRGYAPTRLGAPRVRLDGRTHDVRASV